MEDQFPAFEEVVMRLCGGDAALSRLDLYALSGASRSESRSFAQQWPDIPLEVRRKAMNTLAEGAEANFEMDFNALFRCALTDADDVVRFHAIEGLWECEEQSLIEPLAVLLRGSDIDGSGASSSVKVRAAAALSLARFALKAELGKLPDYRAQRVRNALLDAVNDPIEEADVRRRAVEGIAYLGIDEVRGIIDAAYGDSDLRMRASAVFAMGRSADPFWAQTILMELDAAEDEIRYEAARAAGEMQLPKAVPSLIVLLQDPDLEIQESAIWALGQIGGAKAKAALERCAEACDDSLQPAIEEALAEVALGNTESFVLFELGSDDDDDEDEKLGSDEDGWDVVGDEAESDW
jgi:HEAT repeat protein